MEISKKLLSGLALEKDLSLNSKSSGEGKFKVFTSTLKGKLSELMLLNLLVMLFAAPIFIIIQFIMPNMEQIATKDFNFTGNIGIAYPGAIDTFLNGKVANLQVKFIVLAMLIPCFSVLGIGFAGLMYCVRNHMWGVPVKLRVHFWRGIKLYWWKYLLVFTIIGVLVFGVGGSIIKLSQAIMLGGAPWWLWLLTIVLCAFALLFALFMLFYLPMMVCYRFKYSDLIKNSTILGSTMILTSLIILVVMVLPTLLLLSGVTSLIFLMLMVLFGFSFYGMIIMAYGQYMFENFINALYELKQQEQIKLVKKKKKAPQTHATNYKSKK
ncbi:MAG: hypothetical protein RRY78_01650 [Clostridia bacterium]